MFIKENIKLDFKDILLVPRKSTIDSRQNVILEKTVKFKNTPNFTWNGIPIVVSNMDTTGTFEMVRSLAKQKLITCVHKHYSIEAWKHFLTTISDNEFNYFCVSTGITDRDLKKLSEILNLSNNFKFICVDVANGYTEKFINTLKIIKKLYPDKVIIAGNVVTSDLTEEILNTGVDIVKVGIGSGSVCTTRIKTGVGYPQLSCILETSKTAHDMNGYIMSDGGCTNSGDISKAFCAGSDFVMLGGMFSGHNECSGNIVEKEGIKYKEFYGMSSNHAMNIHSGGMKKYKTEEGKKVLVKYKGLVENTVNNILGGIRSTCTYIGASFLHEMCDKAHGIRVTQQSNEIYGKN